jgi:hypothetical protein
LYLDLTKENNIKSHSLVSLHFGTFTNIASSLGYPGFNKNTAVNLRVGIGETVHHFRLLAEGKLMYKNWIDLYFKLECFIIFKEYRFLRR